MYKKEKKEETRKKEIFKKKTLRRTQMQEIFDFKKQAKMYEPAGEQNRND
jgi:hypothetical protein